MHLHPETPAEGGDQNREGHMPETGHDPAEPFARSEPLETSLTASEVSALDSVHEPLAENVREVVYADCMEAIAAHLDEAIADAADSWPPMSRTSPEAQITRDIITQAVRDRDATTVDAYAQRLLNLPNAPAEDVDMVDIAHAALGNEQAIATMHTALELERLGRMVDEGSEGLSDLNSHAPRAGETPGTDEFIQAILDVLQDEYGGVPYPGNMASEEGRSEPSLHRADQSPPQPLLSRLIRQYAEYGMPPDQWINSYVSDSVERWARTEEYFSARLAIEADTPSAAGIQQAHDAHAALLYQMPDEAITQLLPSVLELTYDSAVRTALIDRYIALADGIPLSPEAFAGKIKVAVGLVNDNASKELTRSHGHFIYTCGRERSALSRQNRSVQLAHDYFPLVEALAQCHGDSADVMVDRIDAWTAQALRMPDADPDEETHLHSQHLRDAALYFAEKGDFVSAHHVTTAIQPGRSMRFDARSRILQMASEPAHLEPFAADSPYQVRGTEYDTELEVATLRVAGDTDELRARALAHVRAAGVTGRPLPFAANVSASSQEEIMDATHNAEHIAYAEAAFNAVRAVDPARAIDMASEILPILRTIGRTRGSLVSSMSEVLIAAGDIGELQTAFSEALHTSPSILPADVRRPEEVAALWNLAQRLRRAGRAAEGGIGATA